MKDTFEIITYQICNYQYTTQLLADWIDQYDNEFSALLGDHYLDFLNAVPNDRNAIAVFLAGELGFETTKVRFNQSVCTNCAMPRLRPSLGSFRSYGEFVAQSTEGRFFLHTHCFNENKDVWDFVNYSVDEHTNSLQNFDLVTLRQRVFCNVIDPIEGVSFELLESNRRKGCLNCGSEEFSFIEEFFGVLLAAKYETFMRLTTDERKFRVKSLLGLH